ncbi:MULTISPECIES: hypothetical protein [unclassified Streptomyces]|uniref:hypothetical protein n=1 Tax=unclassified Streptomyces TaxID=2593676 RepID=UPI0038022708
MFEAFGDSRPPARLEKRSPQDARQRIEASLPMPEPGPDGAPSVDLFAVPASQTPAGTGTGLGRLHRMSKIATVRNEQGAGS